MTSPTYELLKDLSLRRIEREWLLTDSQRCVMRAITLLSYGEGQSWALIPCQGQLARALRVNKATICRALRSCILLGILERLERQRETLYRVRPNADQVPMRADDESEKAMQQLTELQRTRLQGTADGNGQLRLDGILPSEEIEAPADAFEASMALDAVSDKPTEDLPSRSRSADDEDESDEDFHKRLEQIVKDGPPRSTQAEDKPREAFTPRGDESRWLSGITPLSGDKRRIMEELRAECRATNKRSEADLIQWVYRWRKEVDKRPRLVEELVREHRYRRQIGQGFEITCKFISKQLAAHDSRERVDTS